MLKVFVLRGLPGAGKSFAITTILRDLGKANPGTVRSYVTCSADDYFMVDGKYCFDGSKLPEAHASCMRAFINCLHDEMRDQHDDPPSVIFVDNTNLSVAEMAPYVAVGQAYGAEVGIITIECDPEVAAARNTHGVPPVVYDGLVARMEAGTKGIMPWWAHTTVKAG